jgi:hypothetical protein
MKKIVLLLALPAIAILYGCAHTIVPNVTPLQYDSDSMELLGPVTGEASKTSVFFGMFEMPPAGDSYTTQAAIQDALRKVHGDAILNPTVDEELKDYAWLYTTTTLRVSGLAIRFKSGYRATVPVPVNDSPLPAPTPTPIPSPTPVTPYAYHAQTQTAAAQDKGHGLTATASAAASGSSTTASTAASTQPTPSPAKTAQAKTAQGKSSPTKTPTPEPAPGE